MIVNLFPSASEMELDYWTASPEVAAYRKLNRCRLIRDKEGNVVAAVPTKQNGEDDRDVRARRIEMVGEIYEELRLLADRAQAAGLDVAHARDLLGNFVVPKPLPNGGK